VLDVRHREESEAFPIEGRGPLPARNVPYFEMLEAGGSDDLVDSVASYVEAELGPELPRDMPLLAVCAKGGTSEFVTQALRRLGYDAVNLAGGMAAWGDHYSVRRVAEGSVSMWQVARPARGCLSYVVAAAGCALIVDPGRHLDPYLGLLADAGLRAAGVIDTHAHADHISGGAALARGLGVPYFLHPYDAIHPIDLIPSTISYTPLRDGMRLDLGPVPVEVLWSPGHTLGNITLRVAGTQLLAGDTIFVRSVARPDLGGRADAWAPLHHRSLERLLALPDETVVRPGHFSSRAEADARGEFAAPLCTLRTSNRELQRVARGADEFVGGILASLPSFPNAYAEIKRVNAGLAQADEERAAELELGKNRCALTGAER